MEILITILSVYGLAFAIKESDGPWGVMAWLRNRLIKNKYVGVFFFKLLSCYFCTGTWCGIAIYLLTTECIKLSWLPVWGLAGGAVCVILEAMHSRLLRE